MHVIVNLSFAKQYYLYLLLSTACHNQLRTAAQTDTLA